VLKSRLLGGFGATIAGLALVSAACGGSAAEPAPPAASLAVEATVAPVRPSKTANAVATPGTPLPETATASPVHAAPSPTPTQSPPAPRAIRYGDLTYTVEDVLVSHETPRSYGSGGLQEIVSGSYVYVKLGVRNELRSVTLSFDSGLFGLRSGGSVTPSQWVRSQPASLSLEPGSTAIYVTGFPLTGSVLPEDAALVIAQAGKAAGVVALAGPVAPSPYPHAATIDGKPVLIPAANGCHVTIQPLSATVDLDAGIDLPGISGQVDGGRRAAAGERFLRIVVHATSDTNPCGGASVPSELFHLRVDGASAAVANYVGQTVKVGSPQNVTLLFRVPAGARDAVLLGGTAATWAVTIND
jgi:hypothetical protein